MNFKVGDNIKLIDNHAFKNRAIGTRGRVIEVYQSGNCEIKWEDESECYVYKNEIEHFLSPEDIFRIWLE